VARKKVRPERIIFPICIREIVISVERLSTGGVKVERESQAIWWSHLVKPNVATWAYLQSKCDFLMCEVFNHKCDISKAETHIFRSDRPIK
jgi:hypothetical protein